ncbi:hypothetical protein CHK_2582 [Christensenella hongkongensis]|uniref:Uncharacterized protein n=1 Tax=Christensenella hongkongensis TaxID=270498 RepID=A0A0M2NG83_9FIRM|nr:hypothetical protein CHK_2582 [Christensenella hongkongensis]
MGCVIWPSIDKLTWNYMHRGIQNDEIIKKGQSKLYPNLAAE